jgi:hypothetical protein
VDRAGANSGVCAAAVAIAGILALGGCGWRTGLDEGIGPLDGGPGTLDGAPPPVDGAQDGPSDAPPPPDWDVVCSEEQIVVSTRQQVVLEAQLPDDVEIVLTRWRITERPEGSTARPEPRASSTTTFAADLPGLYVLEFTATDAHGQVGTCEVHVEATPSAPDAICPPVIETTPLTTVQLEGDGRGDRAVVGYRWEVVRQPDGSAARGPSPADARIAEFTPDVAGEYVLRLTVTDEAGETGTCQTRVLALSSQGLRVEIFWNGPPDRSCNTWTGPPPCDDTDVDVHLLRPGNEFWFDADGDCHWWNCTGGLSWGSPGSEDDPRLDIDVVDGFGPENINVDAPFAGTYRVGVDFWDGHSGDTADVTVNIYCGERQTEPVATFGPVTLHDRPPDRFANDFWIVADVDIDPGRPCRVIDLARPGGRPRIITHGQARMSR